MRHETKKFFWLDSEGQEAGRVHIEHLWSDVFALKFKVANEKALPQLAVKIPELLKSEGPHQQGVILCRIVKGEIASAEMSRDLPFWGFQKKSERIEFKTPVTDLPETAETSLVWRTAEELAWSPEKVADLLERVAVGDPDYDPTESGLSFIQDFLQDPQLTAGLSCIYIGFKDEAVAALTVVQTHLQEKWSRISFMGVLPEMRNQDIGLKMHRYSFKIMRQQGGLIYHGGTNAKNTGMLTLFRKNNCQIFREMEEWSYSRGRTSISST